MRKLRILSVGGVAASALFLAGCGASGAPTSAPAAGGQANAQASGGGPDPAAAPGAGGDATAGGEPASFRYADPVGRWQIYGPGSMTSDGRGNATYQGPHDRLTVAFTVGSSDATAAADAASRSGTAANYQITSPPSSTTIGGRPSVIYEYQQDGPANPVTGKSTVLRGARAYVPGGGGIYLVEYSSTGGASTWDPQGAKDILTTFVPGR